MQSDRYFSIIHDLPRVSITRSRFFADPPDHFNNQSLSTYYESRTYLAITEYEIIADAELFQGFRYSLDDFSYLERDTDINIIQSNGGFTLFIIIPS